MPPWLYAVPLILAICLPPLCIVFEMFDEGYNYFIFDLIIMGSAVVWACICMGVNEFFSGSITKKRLKKFAKGSTEYRRMIYSIVEVHNQMFPEDKVSVDELLKC